MARIVCDAVAFGFGPAGKLLAVLDALHETDVEVVVLASGTTAQLFEGREWTVVHADTGSRSDLARHADLIRSADVFVNVMNPLSAGYAAHLGVPVLAVDSLFWMWDELAPELASADWYFIQNFPGVADRFADERPHMRNPHLVGPIVERVPAARRRNQVLVNFGGLESALVGRNRGLVYPYLLTEVLAPLLADSRFEHVVVTGSAPIMADLAERHPLPRVRYARLDHRAFLHEVASADLLVTSPGLTASFEAFSLGTPVVFLPPQNYSQWGNLLLFREAGVGTRSLHWLDVFPDLPAVLRMPEVEGVAMVLDAIRRCEVDPRARAWLAEGLAGLLDADAAFRADQVLRQRRFVAGLGPDGATAVADAISTFLGSTRRRRRVAAYR